MMLLMDKLHCVSNIFSPRNGGENNNIILYVRIVCGQQLVTQNVPITLLKKIKNVYEQTLYYG